MPLRPAPRRPPARALPVAACALAVLALAGCAGDDPGPTETVTVSSAPETSAEPPATTVPEDTGPTSDVTDRAHDVGTVAGVEAVDGTAVLEMDRWTYADWSEEKVSQEGVPLEPLTENPFRNQNSDSTYAVPVSPDVVVGLNSCTVGTQGTDQQPRIATVVGSVEDLAAGDTIWLLTYTDGVLTQADTAAVC